MAGQLGIALGDALKALGQQGQAMPQMAQPSMPEMPKLSKGQLIAGILADALSGAAGQPGQFAASQRQVKRDYEEEAKWHRNQQAQRDNWLFQQQFERANPGPSPIERDATAWQRMTPEQRAALGQMKQATAGDPDVFMTLPNGQVYAGPRSGLQNALGGQPKAAPKGKLTPIGGPVPQAPGSFR